MLVTFGAATGLDPGARAAIAGGALIAPYFLFSATAGELADRFERARLLQILKAAELVAVLGRRRRIARRQSRAVCWSCCSCSAPRRRFRARCNMRCCRSISRRRTGRRQRADEGGTFLSILFGTIAGGIAVALAWGTDAACICCCAARGCRLRREPAGAARPGPDARPAPQPQPDRGDRRDPAPGLGAPRRQDCRSSARRGSGWSARCSCRRCRPSPRRRSAPAAAS